MHLTGQGREVGRVNPSVSILGIVRRVGPYVVIKFVGSGNCDAACQSESVRKLVRALAKHWLTVGDCDISFRGLSTALQEIMRFVSVVGQNDENIEQSHDITELDMDQAGERQDKLGCEYDYVFGLSAF